MKSFCCLLALAIAVVVSTAAQDAKSDSMKDCPMHQLHTADSHHATVARNGDQAMGFPHDKTTHHFHLRGDGGTIEVSANDPKDQRNIAAIRSHLSHIAQLFAGGDFTTPMSIHETVPPGAASMRLLKSAITYEYEQNASGGQVRIVSKDAVAIAAIHDFLRFQITEHETGDSPDVQNAH